MLAVALLSVVGRDASPLGKVSLGVRGLIVIPTILAAEAQVEDHGDGLTARDPTESLKPCQGVAQGSLGPLCVGIVECPVGDYAGADVCDRGGDGPPVCGPVECSGFAVIGHLNQHKEVARAVMKLIAVVPARYVDDGS